MIQIFANSNNKFFFFFASYHVEQYSGLSGLIPN